jgi:ABC-2 type transport system permease protein
MSATLSATRPATRLSAVGVIRSEWIKLRSLRSTVWSYAIIVVVSLGMALLLSSTVDFGGQPVPAEVQQNLALQASTFGIYFGQLIVAVLGVLVISGEYATGMIRSTLAAVPKRVPALAAKALVLFVTTFVVGLVSTFGSLLIVLPILSSKGIETDLGDASLLGNLVLGSVYLALVAVFALGVGTILRSSAGGIAAALGVILLLPTILQVIAGLTGAQWAIDLMPYLLSNAGVGTYTPPVEGAAAVDGSEALEQWQNALVVLAWAAVSLIGGALLLKRRDA